ncbi:glycosyltransferase [Schaalia sp. 19OD2882]|uniref:glycosyltransferase n=1 Tax=Schaalia sp. 19OD2882 TaxID=2794089 RepID=UPI0020A8285C|nr:glycosyltransferase [Schaalia sp. 19OD2882]
MTEDLPPFSVLLPVYIGDRADHFSRALRSVGADQSLPADEILVVCDGPVRPEVDQILSEAEAGQRPDLVAEVPLRVHRLPVNRGLTEALNHGLAQCAHEVVARADADDISVPERFALQIPMIVKGFDLVGAGIAEFDTDETRPGLVRRMPLGQEEIREVVTYRDPFNHPTVVYRRSAVDRVGGYEHVDHMEDYWLFARMVAAGVPCANHPEALVLYRVGAGAYSRRGGFAMLRSELALQRRMRARRITTVSQCVRNVAVRGVYRLIPSGLRRALYHAVGKGRWFRQAPHA